MFSLFLFLESNFLFSLLVENDLRQLVIDEEEDYTVPIESSKDISICQLRFLYSLDISHVQSNQFLEYIDFFARFMTAIFGQLLH